MHSIFHAMKVMSIAEYEEKFTSQTKKARSGRTQPNHQPIPNIIVSSNALKNQDTWIALAREALKMPQVTSALGLQY